MAEIKKGILSGVSGLVGTVVGATFRGLDILRSRPKKSSKPAVQSQIDQRFKFALVTTFLSRFEKFIKESYKPKSKLHSPMNAAVQYNLLNAVMGISPTFHLDYSKVELSNGKLEGASILSFAAVADGRMLITWDLTDNGRYGPDEKEVRDTDVLRLAIWCEETGFSLTDGYGTVRSKGTSNVRLAVADPGNKVHVWMFFVAADGKSTSRSVYLGSVVALD